MFRNQREWLLYQQDGGGGGGGGNGGQGDQNNGGPQLSADEIAAFRTFVASQGGDAQANQVLFAENARLKTQLKAARERQIPEGALILVGEDVETWKNLRGLDIPLADVKAAMQERDQLRVKVSGMERDTQLRNVAGLANWNPDVLIKLDRLDGAKRVYEVKMDEEGQQYVTVREGDKETLTASEYAQRSWAEFLPALSAKQAAQSNNQSNDGGEGDVVSNQPGHYSQQNNQGDGGQGNGQGNNRQQNNGTSYVKQPAGSNKQQQKDTPTSIAASYLQSAYARTSEQAQTH